MSNKQIQVWTVRNLQGQFLGSYKAFTDKQAIQRLIDEQMALASTFKKSHSRINLSPSQFVAKVEA